MEAISVFDIFKIGVGPSSSHTMGPWRAAEKFVNVLRRRGVLASVRSVRVDLFGSLAKTGKGHGTDFAVILGLSGEDPVTCDPSELGTKVGAVEGTGKLILGGEVNVGFVPERDIMFHMDRALPFHANGMTCTAKLANGDEISETYYSVGGGFVVQEQEEMEGARCMLLPFPIQKSDELLEYCEKVGLTIPQVVRRNERVWRNDTDIDAGILNIWRVMQECMYRGCTTVGTLPGGLNVVRRGAAISHKLFGVKMYTDLESWKRVIKASAGDFQNILKMVSCFALAVNEENAAFGRVVTAPTNGAAGVIPAVLMYYEMFCRSTQEGVIDFLLTAGEIGSLFKKGATISAAMGGCQAEIGVSSAMAAGGLAQALGGTPGQVCMAAEIAMEHHLGMTCDPIGGLVQIPCIERNTMGAIKAITAAHIALESDPARARVSLDDVIATMWETAKDMNGKYKETAEGGLAVQISVSVSEC
jgi:L-serine dehydratase